MKKLLPLALALALSLSACEQVYWEDHIYGDEAMVAVVHARVETPPVPSTDDAADDPAVWYNSANPAGSLIIGTDKNSGILVYTLDGAQLQYLPSGEPNNIDLRQNVRIGGFRGDLAAASNRAGDVVSLYSVNEQGVTALGEFKSLLAEPYGFCMGRIGDRVLVFVTYKTGEVQAHLLQDITAGGPVQTLAGTIALESQLEGCVHDDETGVLYIGEEGRGVWYSRLTLTGDSLTHDAPALIDEVGSSSGIVADIEGMGLYVDGDAGYLVVSSQGNHSYAVYDRTFPHAFRGRFRILQAGDVDGAQETDGLEVSARSFGTAYPDGLLVVQDGYPDPVSQAQNFKIVDWRDVADALGL